MSQLPEWIPNHEEKCGIYSWYGNIQLSNNLNVY